MRLYLKTADGLAELWLGQNANQTKYFSWQADRQLAKGILSWMENCLEETDSGWRELSSLAVFRGPGSYTSLRIGITVMNTLADQLQIPIVGADGEAWRTVADARLSKQESDQIVLPLYSAPPNIGGQ